VDGDDSEKVDGPSYAEIVSSAKWASPSM
jgi:hypothetical protein